MTKMSDNVNLDDQVSNLTDEEINRCMELSKRAAIEKINNMLGKLNKDTTDESCMEDWGELGIIMSSVYVINVLMRAKKRDLVIYDE